MSLMSHWWRLEDEITKSDESSHRSWSWWGSSVGKTLVTQAWWPKSCPWSLRKVGRELIPQSCPLPSVCCRSACALLFTAAAAATLDKGEGGLSRWILPYPEHTLQATEHSRSYRCRRVQTTGPVGTSLLLGFSWPTLSKAAGLTFLLKGCSEGGSKSHFSSKTSTARSRLFGDSTVRLD